MGSICDSICKGKNPDQNQPQNNSDANKTNQSNINPNNTPIKNIINEKNNLKSPQITSASNDPQLNEDLKIDKYEIDYSKLIGKGAFGEIYLGKHKKTQKDLAFKIEQNNPDFSYLLNEYKVYRKLRDYNKIPKIYDCFQNDNKNYLVMEILGKSLDSIFKSYNKKFSLPTVLNLGIQFLDIIEYIHSKNIIHRDLKPDCFLVGKKNKSKIYIIDFGFAVNYIDPKLHLHYPLRQDIFVGNYKFTSDNTMLYGYNKSRRDDIEAIAYILIYFLKGFLPWENKKNKVEMQIARRQTSTDILCAGLPLQIKTFLNYSRNLKFKEKPDYEYLRNLLKECAENKNITLTTNNYDWIISENFEFLETKTFVTITNKEFDNQSEIVNSRIEKNVINIIEANYTKNKNAFKINNILRTKGIEGLDDKDYETFYALNKAINNYETEEDYLVHRYVDDNYLISMFNFTPTNDLNYNLSKIKENIGTIMVEKGFMSCYMTDMHVIKRNILLEIQIPKGTNAYITKNKEESELILGCNTEYQIMDAKIVNDIIQINISILNNKKSISLLPSSISDI